MGYSPPVIRRHSCLCLLCLVAPLAAAGRPTPLPSFESTAQVAAPVAFSEPLDAESVVFSYLLRGAESEGDPLSDLALTHYFRSLIALPASEQRTDQAKQLLLKLGEAATEMEARTAPRLMADPALLTLRVGPMSLTSDTPDQRALWVKRLEIIGADNVYSALKVMDWARSARNPDAFSRSLVMAATGSTYNDYKLAVAQAVFARFSRVPLPPSAVSSPAQVAIDVNASPLLDLYSNSWICRADQAEIRKLCSIIYRHIGSDALDPDTARLAAVVLETIGDAEQRTEARRTRREIDWIVYSVGVLLMSGSAKGLEAHDKDRIDHGLLAAHRNLLRANGVEGVPPAGWVSPNPVQSLDGADGAAESSAR